MATCAQYATIPCNAMSKAEYAEYIEAGGEPNPLPKPSGGKMGDRSSTASTNTAGVGRDYAAHDRRIRPNLTSATASLYSGEMNSCTRSRPITSSA